MRISWPLKYLEAGNPSEVFNLGNGNGYSVRQIIDIARAVTNRDITVTYADSRPGDPATLIASSAKAMRVLDWKPKLHDIETIIATAWQWHSRAAKTWKTIMRIISSAHITETVARLCQEANVYSG